MLNIKNNSQELFNQNQILIIYGEKIEVVSNSSYPHVRVSIYLTGLFVKNNVTTAAPIGPTFIAETQLSQWRIMNGKIKKKWKTRSTLIIFENAKI